MYAAVINQVILSIYWATVVRSVPLEVNLLLADLIYTNNISQVLHISHHPDTEKLTLRDNGFPMIHDVNCAHPEILENSKQHFLAADDAFKVNIIIDCGSDRPIENTLLKILPLEEYTNKSSLFLLPMFNIIIISKELPNLDEQMLLEHTKDLMLALAYITEPEVLKSPDASPMLLSCKAYSVYKHHQSKHTKSLPGDFNMMATVNRECTIEGRTDILLHTFSGFMGRQVDVGIIVNPPFLTQDISDHGEVVYGGLFKVFLDSLSDKLNFTYKMIPTVDGSYGVHNEAGEWGGLIGMLQHMEIDIVMAGLSMTAARDIVVDFTIPFWEEPVIAVYHASKPDIGWLYLFKPFQYQVWLVILASILVASFFMWSLQFCVFHKSERASSRNPCLSWRESSWVLLGGCISQSAAFLPSTMPSKSVFISFFLTAVLVVAHYNGNLKATTVFPDRTSRYSTLKQLTADKEVTIHMNGGGANQNILETSRRGILKGIWQLILSREDSLSSSAGDAVYRMMQNPSHVAIGDRSEVLPSLIKNDTFSSCKWDIIPETLYTSHYALAIPQHSPYRSVINNVISKLVETGLMKKWFQQAIPLRTCYIETDDLKPVDLNQMRAMMVLLAIGIIMGTAAAIMESCCYRRRSD